MRGTKTSPQTACESISLMKATLSDCKDIMSILSFKLGQRWNDTTKLLNAQLELFADLEYLQAHRLYLRDNIRHSKSQYLMDVCNGCMYVCTYHTADIHLL
jgi:hypothetical protein